MKRSFSVADFRGSLNEFSLKPTDIDNTTQHPRDKDVEKDNYSSLVNSDVVVQQIDAIFICACADEYNAALEYLKYNRIDVSYLEEDEGYYFKLLRAKREISCIIVQQKEQGMVSCSCLSGSLFRFNPKVIAMPGICGGIPGKVSQGDIVVATTTYDYGSGKYLDNGTFEPAPFQIQINSLLRRAHSASKEDFVRILGSCPPNVFNIKEMNGNVTTKNSDNIKVISGVVATGAAVVNNQTIVKSMQHDHRNVIAYDMEAYALAYTCTNFADNPIPWLVVKGVQDLPEATNKSAYTKLAATVSFSFTVDVIKRFL